MSTPLAGAVGVRRRELGLSYGRVEQKRGPNAGLVSQIERGLVRSYTEDTLLKLDRALSWIPGTCSAILHGYAGDDPAAWVDTSPPPAPRPDAPARAHDVECVWKRRYEKLLTHVAATKTRPPTLGTKQVMAEDYYYWDYATRVAEAVVEQAAGT